MGVAGVKIDFMDRSDQWMIHYYERMARKAFEKCRKEDSQKEV